MKRIVNILIHLIVVFLLSTICDGGWALSNDNTVVKIIELVITISLIISAATMLYEPFAELAYAIKSRKIKYKQKLELREAKHQKKLLDYIIDEEERAKIEEYLEQEEKNNEENQIQPEDGEQEEIQ